MGLLNKILGNICGISGQTTKNIEAIILWVEQQGGIQAIVSHLQSGQYSDTVKSWLSNGDNIALSGEIIQKMLTSESVQQLADSLGININEASGLLATYLPQFINHVSNDGIVDQNADLTSVVSQLVH